MLAPGDSVLAPGDSVLAPVLSDCQIHRHKILINDLINVIVSYTCVCACMPKQFSFVIYTILTTLLKGTEA